MSNIELWKEEPEPEWLDVLFAVARDHRHNLFPDVIELWKQKLKPYTPEIVITALRKGEWDHCPSSSEVIKEIKLMQEKARQEASNREYEKFKEQQKFAAENGLLATDEDYAKMNDEIRKVVGTAPAKDKPKVYYPSTKPPSKEELNRRKEEQLKAVYEKYGAKK